MKEEILMGNWKWNEMHWDDDELHIILEIEFLSFWLLIKFFNLKSKSDLHSATKTLNHGTRLKKLRQNIKT